MRSILRYSISAVLLLTVLFSLSGLTIFRHKCLISGDVSYSLFAPIDDCCTEKFETEGKSCCSSKSASKKVIRKKKSCCSESSFSQQLNFHAFSSLKSFQQDSFFIPLVSGCKFVSSTISKVYENHLPNGPPELSGRDILVRNQVFRI